MTKPTCHALSAWLNTGAIRSLKVTGKLLCSVVMALPSKLLALVCGVCCEFVTFPLVSDCIDS